MQKPKLVKRESVKFDSILLDEMRGIAATNKRTLSGELEYFVLWALQDYNNGLMDPKGK